MNLILKQSHVTAIILFTVVVGSSAALVASAQENTTTTSEQAVTTSLREAALERQESRQEERAELIENQREIQTERVETRQDLRTVRQAALSQVRQERVINLAANISNRMEAAVARLFAIIERLETRIEKQKQAGQDTAETEAKLREAAGYIASARASLVNIDTLVYNAATSERPFGNWQEVRSTYQEAARLIRTSHQTLRETIVLLKSASITRTEESLSSIENEAE